MALLFRDLRAREQKERSIVKFETETSVYELTIQNGEFVLEKVKVKKGKESSIPVGQTWRGDTLRITELNQIGIGAMHTSSVVKF